MILRPGPRNLITDVDGIGVGCAEDLGAITGTTVVLPERPCVIVSDVRGGAPGTRETDADDMASVVERLHAVVLSGGSALGLAAADGVAAAMSARGDGIVVAPGAPSVPVIPSAILFDLANGGDKDWGEAPPYRELGQAALRAVGADFALGNSGAGMGALAGNLKGGLGAASFVTEEGLQVGALIAVNAVGSVLMPGTGVFWAWPHEIDGEFGGARPSGDAAPAIDWPEDAKLPLRVAANTTIGVVATNADLTRGEAKRLAIMAQDGLARAIRPAHTPFDGDTIFAMASATAPLAPEGGGGGGDEAGLRRSRPAALARLGAIASDCVARAVARGVYEARAIGGASAYRDRF